MSYKTIVVTGANRGLGFSLIEQLMAKQKPYKFILTSRNEENAIQAVERLTKQYPTYRDLIDHDVLDVSDESSTLHFCNWFEHKHGKADI